MSNIDPGVEITNTTSNVILKIDPATMFIFAKIAGNFPTFGSLYLKGIKITVNSKTFVRIYPA